MKENINLMWEVLLLKYLNSCEAFNNTYHLVYSTKYRQNLFLNGIVRNRISELLVDKYSQMNVKLIAKTVAYNHVHILVQSDLDVPQIASIFGYISKKIGEEFPGLKTNRKGQLWGGKSCTFIENEKHFEQAKIYIEKHLPDNTKLD